MNPSLTKLVSVSKANIGHVLFCVFIFLDVVSGCKNEKKKNKGNYPAVQTSRLVNKLANTVKHHLKTQPQPKKTEPSPTSLLLVGQKI